MLLLSLQVATQVPTHHVLSSLSWKTATMDDLALWCLYLMHVNLLWYSKPIAAAHDSHARSTKALVPKSLQHPIRENPMSNEPWRGCAGYAFSTPSKASVSSPLWCMPMRMSLPPTKSPLIYTCTAAKSEQEEAQNSPLLKNISGESLLPVLCCTTQHIRPATRLRILDPFIFNNVLRISG